MTILLIEDSKVAREQLAKLLRERFPPPLEILEAATVADAMMLLRERAPDAALLDLQLDEGTGFDLLEQMRAERIAVPVVVLTNHATLQHRERCLQAGARAFFDKSLDFERAVLAVGQAAGGGDNRD